MQLWEVNKKAKIKPACAIQILQKPTQGSFHPGPISTIAQGGFHPCETNTFDRGGQSHSDEKNRFHIGKNEEKPCSTCLKAISPRHIHLRYQNLDFG